MRLKGRCRGSLPTVRMLVATRSPVTSGDCPWSGTVQWGKASNHHCRGSGLPPLYPEALPLLEHHHRHDQEKPWRGLGHPAPKPEPPSSSSPQCNSFVAQTHCLLQAILDSPLSLFDSLMTTHTVLGPQYG